MEVTGPIQDHIQKEFLQNAGKKNFNKNTINLEYLKSNQNRILKFKVKQLKMNFCNNKIYQFT